MTSPGLVQDYPADTASYQKLEVTEPPPRTAAEFHSAYRQSLFYAEKAVLLDDDTLSGMHKWKSSEVGVFVNNWMTSLQLCIQREWTFFIRDKAFLIANVIQNVILGVVLGTIYFQVKPGQWMDRYGAIYTLLSVITVKGLTCVPIYFDHRAVFYKQKRSNFFQISAYAVAFAIVCSLYVVIDVLTFGLLFYLLSGFSLTENALPLLTAILILAAGGLAMQQCMRFFTYVARDQKGSLSMIGLILILSRLFSGYITARDKVPVYWIPVVYFNPVFYIFQASISPLNHAHLSPSSL